ncbi:hypothetical protein F4679DRAFT_581444 [Xylaria curta]|nr:hypothetical protein F4679DRAFT_581444 [Xylaria curta]
MSSTPPSQPRVYVLYYGDETKELTKAEYLEYGANEPVWEYSSADELIFDLKLTVAEFHDQSDLDWAGRASAMLLSQKARPDEIDDKAVYFIRQSDTLIHHVRWLEHFARADPQNINAMIQDALEFPDPPWQPEDEQVEPAEQTEQGENPQDSFPYRSLKLTLEQELDVYKFLIFSKH